MIGRCRPIPTKPGTEPADVHVSLRYHYTRGDWVPIATNGRYESKFEAARECVAYLKRMWPGVIASAKVVCALAANPDIDFDVGDFDADTLRHAARSLAQFVEKFDAEIDRLLDEPAPYDPIFIDAERYRQNPESGYLEPESEESDDDDHLTDDERARIQPHLDAILCAHDAPDSDGTVMAVEELPTPRNRTEAQSDSDGGSDGSTH